MTMTPNRPYLIRAFYEWIVDNGCTPYLLVNAYYPGVEVPQEHVSDGQIILNLAPSAIAALSLGNDMITFSTRFGGVPTEIFLPSPAILGIYARENGQGMIFDTTDDEPDPDPTPKGPASIKSVSSVDKPSTGGDGSNVPKKPSLRVVK